jgi:GNAT superfamily N-acetyltransferase
VGPALVVRDATADDIEAVRSIAAAAWRDTYAGLIGESTIEAFLERSYGVERVTRRIRDDTFLLAVTEDGAVVAFANAREAEGYLHLLAIYADPGRRGGGAGTALLDELRRRFPGEAIAAEVLRGNRKGETFYEARGFVPRETVEADLFAERIVEQRWWLDPQEPPAPGAGPAFSPSGTSGW